MSIMVCSSVPKPFIADLKVSPSSLALNDGYGTTVGLTYIIVKRLKI